LPESPDKDPVVSQSLATYLLIASLLLLITLGWSLYDEFFGLRPWKDYQRTFIKRYGAFLKKQVPIQRAKEKAIENSPEYAALKQQLQDLQKAADPQARHLDAESALVEARTTALLNVLTTARAYVGSQIYIIEHTSSARSKRSRKNDLDQYEKGPFVVSLPSREGGGKDEVLRLTFDQLQNQFNELQHARGQLLLAKAALLRPISELQGKVNSYIKDHIDGPTVEALQSLCDNSRLRTCRESGR